MNCVINGYNANSIIQAQLLNCIIYYSSGTASISFPSSTIAINCVSIGFYNLFSTQPGNRGNKRVTYGIFKDFTGSDPDNQLFELTEEAKTKYVDDDGVEIGMHGGIMPFNLLPSYPTITKMNVANKTTADGKLSVEIEVSSAE